MADKLLTLYSCHSVIITFKNLAIRHPQKSFVLSSYDFEQLITLRCKLTGPPFRLLTSGASCLAQFETREGRQKCHEAFDDFKTRFCIRWLFRLSFLAVVHFFISVLKIFLLFFQLSLYFSTRRPFSYRLRVRFCLVCLVTPVTFLCSFAAKKYSFDRFPAGCRPDTVVSTHHICLNFVEKFVSAPLASQRVCLNLHPQSLHPPPPPPPCLQCLRSLALIPTLTLTPTFSTPPPRELFTTAHR